jgi:hypothetical protein
LKENRRDARVSAFSERERCEAQRPSLFSVEAKKFASDGAGFALSKAKLDLQVEAGAP